jgi:hypothetical protein
METRTVVPSPIVVETGAIVFAPGELERIGVGWVVGHGGAKGRVGVGRRHCPVLVSERHGRAQGVEQIERPLGAAVHSGS